MPGIGPIVATAIVAAIGNGSAFRKGRDFAAWLGLVPRQYSTGGKAKLLGISKRGNPCSRAADHTLSGVTKSQLETVDLSQVESFVYPAIRNNSLPHGV